VQLVATKRAKWPWTFFRDAREVSALVAGAGAIPEELPVQEWCDRVCVAIRSVTLRERPADLRAALTGCGRKGIKRVEDELDGFWWL
jgi:hypothetical protein